MANNLFTTPLFESKFKRYAKKFPSLDKEIFDLREILVNNPQSGISLGSNLYKSVSQVKIKEKGRAVVLE